MPSSCLHWHDPLLYPSTNARFTCCKKITHTECRSRCVHNHTHTAQHNNRIPWYYHGEVIDGTEVDERYGIDPRSNAPYTITASRTRHPSGNRNVDSACVRSVLSMANSKRRRADCNAEVKDYIDREGKMRMVSIKTIPAGSEIYVYYGAGFFTTMNNSIHTTK